MNAEFWRDHAVLVTGATGLVGSAVTIALRQRGAQVIALIRDWVPESELIRGGMTDGVVVVRGDVTDQALLERVIGEYEIETVLHLAAQTIVGVANRNPASTLETNIAGTWRLLEACRRSPRLGQIVVASSDKAYGAQPELPYREEMNLAGEHPYDVSKSCADLISAMYARVYQVPVAISRCSNFYGGGDLNWNRLIPGTIRSILRGHRPVIRSDGSFVRDYLHVDDAVTAYLSLAEVLATRPELRGEAFNFSGEQPVSVLDLVRRLLALMGSSLEPLILNEATHEIRVQYASAEKARRVLGWQPRVGLDEGLARTIDWYRARLTSAQG